MSRRSNVDQMIDDAEIMLLFYVEVYSINSVSIIISYIIISI